MKRTKSGNRTLTMRHFPSIRFDFGAKCNETANRPGKCAPLSVLMHLRLTLKAFANFSPGFRFGNPGRTRPLQKTQTLKGLRRIPETRRNPLRVATRQTCILTQGFKANPRLELANAFSVKSELRQYLNAGLILLPDVCGLRLPEACADNDGVTPARPGRRS